MVCSQFLAVSIVPEGERKKKSQGNIIYPKSAVLALIKKKKANPWWLLAGSIVTRPKLLVLTGTNKETGGVNVSHDSEHLSRPPPHETPARGLTLLPLNEEAEGAGMRPKQHTGSRCCGPWGLSGWAGRGRSSGRCCSPLSSQLRAAASSATTEGDAFTTAASVPEGSTAPAASMVSVAILH